ncbi:MAG: endonuclease III [Candidatus Dormibacteria bacterium]
MQSVVERLAEEYPAAECALTHANAFELLVATILSAQCTDERVNSVTPTLFARYRDPASLAGAEPQELEELIRPTGFFRMKGQALRAMSQDLVARHGGEVPVRMDDLVELRGVGRKTANVVLGVALGVPGLPVDTHVTRLVARLRLTAHTDPVLIEQDICAILDESEWTNFSLRLIDHGRRVCVARRPRCDLCALNDICPSAFTPTRPARGSVGRRTRPVTRG